MTELEIDLLPGGDGEALVREGWGESEPGGRWMIGGHSRLVLPPPPWTDGPFAARLVVTPFVRPGLVEAQRVALRVNGAMVGEWRLRDTTELSAAIPDGVIRPGAPLDLVIEHPDAVAPGRVEAGGDLRELALSCQAITLTGPERPADAPWPPGPASGEPPVFQLRPRGNLGNRMIQYMVGRAVVDRAPGCRLAGARLGEWGIPSDAGDAGWADHVVTDEQYLDMAAVAARLRRPGARKIAYRGYGQRMENLLPVDAYRPVFPQSEDGGSDTPAFDERHLVINIRAGDILDGSIPDYVVMPPNFYRDLIARTGLAPVFMGQLDANPYTEALRAACPGAVFLPSRGAMGDFATIRAARNIVVSVSTFSWVAAWLSDAARIFMPVNGLFNPSQFPDIDLLPLDDPRYEFHLFPINRAVKLADLAAAHARLEGSWRVASAAELRAARDRARGGARPRSWSDEPRAPPNARAAPTPVPAPFDPREKPGPRLAIVTMVYNEPDYLPIWLNYYTRQTEPAHCYVIDHGSDDGSTEALGDCTRFRIPRSPQDDSRRCVFVSEFCSSLLLWYDAVLYTDVDEIVVPDPRHHGSLRDYHARTDLPVTTAIGVNVIHRPGREPPIEPGRPILRQRPWVFRSSSMCKPVLIRRPVNWSPGFHSSNDPVAFDDLYLFHLRWFDLPVAMRRLAKTRTMAWAHPAAGGHQRVSDPEMLEQFRSFAALPPDEADWDARSGPVAAFRAEVVASQVGREGDRYRVSLDLWGDRLWRVPARFADAF